MAFCTNCGTQLGAGVKFCGGCGTSADAAATPADAAATPAPAKSKAKRIILILLLLIIAAIAATAGVVGYLYIPELIKAKVESYIPAEVFMQTTATVTANTASLYAEQSAKGAVLKTLKKGDVIVVTGLPANGWVPVKSGDVAGWMLPSSIALNR
jgi:hypothetical protein